MKKITKETLKKWDACKSGYDRFNELLPDGSTLEEGISALRKDNHSEWACWLYNHAQADNDYKDQAIQSLVNTGYCNTGNWNTGNRNTGNWNTGNRNTGNWNTGNRNTGDWNTGNWNTGYCNTVTPEDILMFNSPMKRKDLKSFPGWMFFDLTRWIEEGDMSDKERQAYPSYTTTGGYLKVCTSYQHAALESWEKSSAEEKERTRNLPNFDDKVFKEIFGFSALENKVQEKITEPETIEVDFITFNGKRYRRET